MGTAGSIGSDPLLHVGRHDLGEGGWIYQGHTQGDWSMREKEICESNLKGGEVCRSVLQAEYKPLLRGILKGALLRQGRNYGRSPTYL